LALDNLHIVSATTVDQIWIQWEELSTSYFLKFIHKLLAEDLNLLLAGHSLFTLRTAYL
jgi:hypothetical protein